MTGLRYGGAVLQPGQAVIEMIPPAIKYPSVERCRGRAFYPFFAR